MATERITKKTKLDEPYEKGLVIRHNPGELAIWVAVTQVGTMKQALSSWARDYEQEIPEGALSVDVARTQSAEMSTGAYIFEPELAANALRHAYATAEGGERRSNAARLAAQLTLAVDSRDTFIKTVEATHDVGALLETQTVQVPNEPSPVIQ